ncbi:MAG: sulfite exporter TauE/SafE family protein [Proteobacteria bacterium]|nr:sulfite exporter TauE/SafE family protein [Pseudomonadota bacterium]
MVDLNPFADVSPLALVALVAIYFVSFLIRGLVGFGSNTPAVIFSAFILPPHDAVIVSLVAATLSQAQLLPQGLKAGDWRIARPLIAGSFLSILVGVWIFARLEAAWLMLVMGVLLAAAIAADMAHATERLGRWFDPRVPTFAFALAAFAGLFATIAGAGAMYFLSVYTRWACPGPWSFRGTNILVAALFNFWRAGAVALAGLFTPKLLVGGALMLPVALLGGWLGGYLTERIPARRFYRILQVLLLLAAASLAWKGLARI